MALHLVIDVGNTRTKAGLFDQGRLVDAGTFNAPGPSALEQWLAQRRPERIGIGRVGGQGEELARQLGTLAPVEVLLGASPGPIRTLYDDPSSLGVDRWANAVAIAHMSPGRPALAISLGTCITCDLVTADGVHQGGRISPGHRMRAQAMANFTARLPLVDPPAMPPQLGTTTADAMAAGIHHGIRSELGGLIGELRNTLPGLAVVLTGGDAPRYARALESGIFAHPHLTLLGLDLLLSHTGR